MARRIGRWEDNVLIDKYDLEVFTPPCDPGIECYGARERLVVDLSEVNKPGSAWFVIGHYRMKAS